MPFAFLAALIGSLSIHAAALFLPEVDLAPGAEPPPLTAEIVPPPKPVDPPAPQAVEAPRPKSPPPRRPTRPVTQPVTPPEVPGAVSQHAAEAASPPLAEPTVQATPPAATPEVPVVPVLAASGRIRFAVYRGERGFEVGRAEHAWEFAEGRYRLSTLTETSGLAALFRPVRVELESRGVLTARGLRPERFETRRNGAATRENAAFDWSAGEVILERDGRRLAVSEGAQDLASFPYQFAYLAGLEKGHVLTVVSGRKLERYAFDALGEEEVTVPAGTFRTLHLKVLGESVTELWLAPERGFVPVKIRHIDKKGDSYEEHAVELGSP
ncbi:MAG: DUF3108 domain-containing protein [Azonexus sp.]|nr:DUF3108 domain-containing protein [Betaproteobacteria bacterium]MBP6037110.1 DUF3108 domain-containing protein [Azonexus sp.]MBP6907653.1 DUF3108 domain-containing protein [Azonexus sp.]